MKSIFDNTVARLASIGTPTQLTATFTSVCDEFFGIVSLLYYTDDATLRIGDSVLTNTGIIRNIHLVDYNRYAIMYTPIDFLTFVLPLPYRADFQLACEVYINRLDTTNLLILSSEGFAEANIDSIMTLDELRLQLQKRHGVEPIVGVISDTV